jgi:hypothetical protein
MQLQVQIVHAPDEVRRAWYIARSEFVILFSALIFYVASNNKNGTRRCRCRTRMLISGTAFVATAQTTHR